MRNCVISNSSETAPIDRNSRLVCLASSWLVQFSLGQGSRLFYCTSAVVQSLPSNQNARMDLTAAQVIMNVGIHALSSLASKGQTSFTWMQNRVMTTRNFRFLLDIPASRDKSGSETGACRCKDLPKRSCRTETRGWIPPSAIGCERWYDEGGRVKQTCSGTVRRAKLPQNVCLQSQQSLSMIATSSSLLGFLPLSVLLWRAWVSNRDFPLLNHKHTGVQNIS